MRGRYAAPYDLGPSEAVLLPRYGLIRIIVHVTDMSPANDLGYPTRPLIACDFDGTITESDSLVDIIERWASDSWPEIEARFAEGRITLSESIVEMLAQVKATEDEVLDYVLARATVRSGFRELVRWATNEGCEVVVVSSGLRAIVEAVLNREGLGTLRIAAGDATFSREGCAVRYPVRPRAQCVEPCGCCKREALAAFLSPDQLLVYVGDGVSDFCVAETAETVFARAALAGHLEATGRRFHPFCDFHDVRKALGGQGS